MAEKDPAVIGARIARRRQALDMTQQELADAIGVSKSAVANWERGASYPRRKMGAVERVLGPLDEDAARPSSASLEEALERAQREFDEVRRLLRDREPGKGDGNARFAV